MNKPEETLRNQCAFVEKRKTNKPHRHIGHKRVNSNIKVLLSIQTKN